MSSRRHPGPDPGNGPAAQGVITAIPIILLRIRRPKVAQDPVLQKEPKRRPEKKCNGSSARLGLPGRARVSPYVCPPPLLSPLCISLNVASLAHSPIFDFSARSFSSLSRSPFPHPFSLRMRHRCFSGQQPPEANSPRTVKFGFPFWHQFTVTAHLNYRSKMRSEVIPK